MLARFPSCPVPAPLPVCQVASAVLWTSNHNQCMSQDVYVQALTCLLRPALSCPRSSARLPLCQVDDLKTTAPRLVGLNQRIRALHRSGQIQVLNFAEVRKTPPVPRGAPHPSEAASLGVSMVFSSVPFPAAHAPSLRGSCWSPFLDTFAVPAGVTANTEAVRFAAAAVRSQTLTVRICTRTCAVFCALCRVPCAVWHVGCADQSDASGGDVRGLEAVAGGGPSGVCIPGLWGHCGTYHSTVCCTTTVPQLHAVLARNWKLTSFFFSICMREHFATYHGTVCRACYRAACTACQEPFICYLRRGDIVTCATVSCDGYLSHTRTTCLKEVSIM